MFDDSNQAFRSQVLLAIHRLDDLPNFAPLHVNGRTCRSKKGTTRSSRTRRWQTRKTKTRGFPGFGTIEPESKISRASSRSGRPLSCWYRKNSGLAMKPNRLGCFLMLTARDPSPSMKPARNHLALSSHESL